MAKLNMDVFLSKVVSLLERHPPSRLSFSTISRLTGVSRPTLYYYFGKSREALLTEAVRHAMKSYVQLAGLKKGARPGHGWEEFQTARLKRIIGLIRSNAWAPALYIRYRDEAGVLGKAVREIEVQYAHELAARWAQLHGGETPTEASLRISSYVKLGILWGIASDRAYWFDRARKQELARAIRLAAELSAVAMKSRT
jgi:AcrR family transcriptional regulator